MYARHVQCLGFFYDIMFLCFCFKNTFCKNYQNQQIEYSDECLPTQVDIRVRHVLSIELEEYKRSFIQSAHTPPNESPEFCLFDDVAVMGQQEAYCYTCDCHHSPALDLDILLVGPSCKDISYERRDRNKYADCYTTSEGTSGHTYELGFKKTIELTCPAISFFENTVGVSHSTTGGDKKKHRPRVEAGEFFKKYRNICIYIYLLIRLLYM